MLCDKRVRHSFTASIDYVNTQHSF